MTEIARGLIQVFWPEELVSQAAQDTRYRLISHSTIEASRVRHQKLVHPRPPGMLPLSQYLTLLLCAAGAVVGDLTSEQIGTWDRPRAALIRDYVYLEGGKMQTGAWENGSWAVKTVSITNGALFNLSLHRAFDLTGNGPSATFEPILEAAVNNFYLDGYMFADYDEFYAWGGMTLTSMNTAPRTVNDPLYNLPSGKNNDLGTPNTGYSPQDSNFISGVTNGAGANAPSEKLGFYFGGYYNQNGTKYDYFNPPTDEANFLIKVDMSEVTNADWSVTTPQNTSACPWRAEGGLVWIPTSTQGLLIAVGGVETPADLNYYVGEDNTTTSMSFLTEFPVYDIGTDTWSLQPLNANSPVPPHPLAQFCTVVASAANGSHHEIFVYGGWDNDKGDPVSDVWILTVPSFTWIKADGVGQAGAPRQGHVCVSPYPNQMIAIGGTAKAGMSLSTNRTVDVYDLNELNWTSTYDPDVYDDYKPHQTVLQVISATPTASGMSSQVADWFDTQYNMSKVKFYGPYTKDVTGTPSPNNTTAPNNTTTSSPAAPAPSHHSDRAWVTPVAVVVPVVSVLALLGALLFFCRRKRTRQNRALSQGTSELHRRKSWVVPWIWATQSETGRKDIGSDTMTEVEPAQSPPINAGPQELEGGARGDYFSGNGTIQSPHDKWVSSTPARSPQGEYNGLVEAPHSVAVHEVDGGSHFGGEPPTHLSGGNWKSPRTTSMSPPDVSSDPSASPRITPVETPNLSRGPSSTAATNRGSDQPWANLGRVIGVSPLIGSGPEENRAHRHTASVSSGASLPSPGLEAAARPSRSRSRSVGGDDGAAPDGRDAGNHTL